MHSRNNSIHKLDKVKGGEKTNSSIRNMAKYQDQEQIMIEQMEGNENDQNRIRVK